MKRVSAIYALANGAVLLATWVVLIGAGAYATDFANRPLESGFLLAAEVLTGASLIAGGWAIMAGLRWGSVLHFASLGMLLYTCVNSIGVFAQQGNVPAAGFFCVISLATAVVIAGWIHERVTSRFDDSRARVG